MFLRNKYQEFRVRNRDGVRKPEKVVYGEALVPRIIKMSKLQQFI